MRDSASIRAKAANSEVLFEWNDFDGDDCFQDFHINIVNETKMQRFDFGHCVVSGLRRSVRFFRGQIDKAGSGFRVPDVRTYELARTEDGFLLQIRFEGNALFERFHLNKPTLTFDDEFLREYDGDKS